MELSFNTRNYKTLVNKNATIYTNDLNNSQVKIYVSAKVDTVADATLPASWEPMKVDFSTEKRKFDVAVTNKSDKDMVLALIAGDFEGLSIKIGKNQLKPGESSNIEFQWDGEIQKEDYSRSVTFVASTGNDTRFTIPFVVEGTNPTPKTQTVKKPVPQKPASTTKPSASNVKPGGGK